MATRVPAAERRVVTALFADLAGSTRLGEQLDPEVLRDVVSQFFEIAGHEIHGHGGSVEQFSGDAAVGAFGMIVALRHGLDAREAFRAASALAPERPERGGGSTRKMLAEFEKSAYFAESVAPKLRKR